jgi:hypothetical protein
MYRHFLVFVSIFLTIQISRAASPADSIMPVIHCADFRVTGDGMNTAWSKAQWTTLSSPSAGTYMTRIKIMYSDSGIYCLYDCRDSVIKSTMQEDFMDLWHEDVVEVFFWPDERIPVYFEYELSPKNHELPIMVPNYDGNFFGWRPWHYEGKRLIRHAVSTRENAGGGQSWTAEFFIPFALLKPTIPVNPLKGTTWRANFYRIDYDKGQREWYWQPVPGTFHDYKRFGRLVFK